MNNYSLYFLVQRYYCKFDFIPRTLNVASVTIRYLERRNMVFMSLLQHGIPSLSFLPEKLVLPWQSPGHNTGGPSKYLNLLVNKNLFVLRKKKIIKKMFGYICQCRSSSLFPFSLMFLSIWGRPLNSGGKIIIRISKYYMDKRLQHAKPNAAHFQCATVFSKTLLTSAVLCWMQSPALQGPS